MRPIRRAGGVATLLACAVLITTSACGSSADGPDSSDVLTERAPTSTLSDVPPLTVFSDQPTTTVVADEGTLTTSTGIEVSAPFGAEPEDPDFVAVQWLVPWDDGFLAMGVQSSPIALPPELPPEVADFFPPEVIELFPDGLPPTQQEAIELLQDAGLLDAVMQVIDEHPEAYDALTSVTQPDPKMVATWSADGEDWAALDFTPPDGFGDPMQVVVFGDRLTMVGSTRPTPSASFSQRVSVATTTDLDGWVVDSFEVEMPSAVPELVNFYVSPVAVAANDDGWVARVMTDAFLDPTQFLPESVEQLLHEPNTGMGMDPDGVTIERYEDGTVTSVERFTWDELGIGEELRPYIHGAGSTMALWGGPWGGRPESAPSADAHFGMLMATTAGFLDLGDGVAYSPDGITWSAVTTPQPNLQIESAVPLGGDVLAFTRSASGDVAVYRIDPTGETWTMLEVPEAVGGGHSWSQSSSPAFLVETSTFDPGPQQIVVQHEGFELTMTYGAVRSYRLIDESTGAVVLEESIDLTVTQAPDDGPFANLSEDMGSVTITDPDTGEAIVSIPQSVFGAAWNAARSDSSDTADEAPWPDWWVLATHDGEEWLFVDYDEGDGAEPAMPFLVATNDTDALVGSPGWEPTTGMWQRFPMPG